MRFEDFLTHPVVQKFLQDFTHLSKVPLTCDKTVVTRAFSVQNSVLLCHSSHPERDLLQYVTLYGIRCMNKLGETSERLIDLDDLAYLAGGESLSCASGAPSPCEQVPFTAFLGAMTQTTSHPVI